MKWTLRTPVNSGSAEGACGPSSGAASGGAATLAAHAASAAAISAGRMLRALAQRFGNQSDISENAGVAGPRCTPASCQVWTEVPSSARPLVEKLADETTAPPSAITTFACSVSNCLMETLGRAATSLTTRGFVPPAVRLQMIWNDRSAWSTSLSAPRPQKATAIWMGDVEV